MLPFYATMFEFYTYLFTYVCVIVFAFFRLKFLLMFFQQEEYENRSFLSLVFKEARFVDKRLSCIMLAIWLMLVFYPPLCLLSVPAFVWALVREYKVVINAKKKIVITNRVKRLWATAYVLTLLLTEAAFELELTPIAWAIILLQIMPLVLVLANILLQPVEEIGRKKFLKQARAKLAHCKPIVIGVTGSYGKTSTKHFLGHILGFGSSVIFTSGGINTLMGVCSFINRSLAPKYKFFVVEMGAYYRGSIATLCNLVKPQHGIITAIGEQHLSRFKSLSNTAAAKFELADAVRANNPDGIMILNSDEIAPNFLKKDQAGITVGKKGKYKITRLKQTVKGISFNLSKGKNRLHLEAPLYGTHNAEDIALAAAMALSLGVPKSTIEAAVKTLAPVNSRLQPTNVGGLRVLNDGYNSNPVGFAAALDVLEVFKLAANKTKGRTKKAKTAAIKSRAILVTPGMIEMGEQHDKLHADLGKMAAEKVDIVLAVVPERIKAFTDAFREGTLDNQDKQLIEVPTRDAAWEWLLKHATHNDIILFENDLPDNYESSFAL